MRRGRRVWAAFVVIAAGCVASRARADGLFAEPFHSLLVGAGTKATAAADLNGDGRTDLVVLLSTSFSVFVGRGDGGFDPGAAVALSDFAYALAAADVNADGVPDLVVGGSVVSVLLGKGDGSFMAPVPYAVTQYVEGIAIADATGDGRADVVAACTAADAVEVLPGLPGGGFGAAIPYATGANPVAVAVGDVNGDGVPDLVSANYSASTLSVLPGLGGGGFGVKTDLATGPHPGFVTIADFDGDGRPDLLCPDRSGSAISLFHSTGGGAFAPRVNIPCGAGPAAVAFVDVDGDGHNDLLTGNLDANSVSVLPGRGDGTFAAARDFDTGRGPRGIAVADLNGDGHPDLATADDSEGTGASVLLNTGDGTFGLGADAPTGGDPRVVVIRDFDGDGAPDLATVNTQDNTVTVLRNLGNGSFAALSTSGVGVFPTSVAAGDVNGDGIADLVASNSSSGTVSVLLGHGDGTFAPKLDYTTAINPSSVAIGDLNGDGFADLAVATGAHVVCVFLGTGGGAFAPHIDTATLPGECDVVAIGDANADGKTDLAVINGARVSILRGNGDGTFGARTDLATGNLALDAAITDLNGDGRPDVVATHGASVSVFLGTGGGTFGARVDYATGQYPQALAVGDLDLDGKLDVVTANVDACTVTFRPGNGDGTFGPRTDYGAGSLPNWIAIGDLDGDGRPDLAVAASGKAAVTVLRNIGNRPAITRQPANLAACTLANLTLSVQCTGSGLTYRWRKDGVPLADGGTLSGATTPTLAIASAFPVDGGSYDVVVSNTAGSATSAHATVTVCEPPVFSATPAGVAGIVGAAAGYSATLAPSCTAVSLQWLKDGVPLADDGRITGATTATLSISAVQAGDAGYYDLVATNGCGTQATPPVPLTVNPCPAPPTITGEPADVFAANGQPAAFTVAADGCVPPAVQWLKGGFAIPGATSATLAFVSVTGADAGYYRAAVTAGGVSTLSRVAVLNVPAPVFVTASHRYAGTTCAPLVEVFWELNTACNVRVDYELTSASTFAGPLTRSVTAAGAATTGAIDLAPGSALFVCYQITATDGANRTTATPRRMATVPVASFSLSTVVPGIVTYPYAATLVTTGDAVAIGVQVTNGNCASLNAHTFVDQAKLKQAQPRNAAGAITLPMGVAAAIPAGATVRMPVDLRFFKSQVGVATGSRATFSGRLRIDTTPVQYRYFSGSVRIP